MKTNDQCATTPESQSPQPEVVQTTPHSDNTQKGVGSPRLVRFLSFFLVLTVSQTFANTGKSFDPFGELVRTQGTLPELLKQGDLLNQKEIQTVKIGRFSPHLYERVQVSPSLKSDLLIFPLSKCGLKCQLPEVTNGSGVGISPVTLAVRNTLTPAVEEGNHRRDKSAPEHAGTSGNYRNAFKVFLFLWGHEWWVLALWWGILAFPVVVLADNIYGILRYEIFIPTNPTRRYFR